MKRCSDLLMFLFLSLLGLTLFALIEQINIFSFSSHAGFSSFAIAILHGKIMMPGSVWFHVLLFMLAILMLYVVYTCLIYGVARLAARCLRLSGGATFRLGLCLWCLTGIVVLLLNCIYFPLSFYSGALNGLMPLWLVKSALLLLGAALLCFFGMAVWALAGLCVQYRRRLKWLFRGLMLGFVVIIIDTSYASHHHNTPSMKQPNVIIIGIDALRPDYVTPQRMPRLTRFLKNGVVFSQSYTPIARTFASYTSILTGLYPTESKARLNFQTNKNVRLSGSLARLLKQRGYQTFYSTDDSQYTNITKKFGFDELDTNPNSMLNYVLSQLDDFPLFNLVANTFIGRWFFPYTYNNRSAKVIYQPHRYVENVLSSISHLRHRPLFLLVHFCLPHWPYIWANSPFAAPYSAAVLYQAAVKRVDQQVAYYIAGLRKQGLLKHAIVMVLSDHGETLMQKNSRVVTVAGYHRGRHSKNNIFKRLSALQVGNAKKYFSYSYGHGTDIFSLAQVHNFLSWRLFGFPRAPSAHTVKQRISVLDIKPTVMQLLKLPVKNSPQSFSLLPAFYNKPLPRHPFLYFETGYNPTAIFKPPYSQAMFLKEVSPLLTVNPVSDVLTFRPEALHKVLQSKQRGLWYKNWYLAIWPEANEPPIFVLVNLKTHEWTDDLSSAFARRSPILKMLKTLKTF